MGSCEVGWWGRARCEGWAPRGARVGSCGVRRWSGSGMRVGSMGCEGGVPWGGCKGGIPQAARRGSHRMEEGGQAGCKGGVSRAVRVGSCGVCGGVQSAMGRHRHDVDSMRVGSHAMLGDGVPWGMGSMVGSRGVQGLGPVGCTSGVPPGARVGFPRATSAVGRVSHGATSVVGS